VTKKQNAAKSGVLLYIWYGKTVCSLLLFLVYRLHAYLSIVLHHFLSKKSQKTVHLSKEAAFALWKCWKIQVFSCTQRKNTEIAMDFGVFFENQMEL